MQKAKSKERRLTVSVIARDLGCSRQHVYNLIRCGRLPAENPGVRMMRVKRSDYLRFKGSIKVNPDDYYE